MMQDNFQLSKGLRYTMVLETFALAPPALIVYFFTGFARSQWAWTIPPFNAKFIGAIWMAAVILLAICAWTGRWIPTRIALPIDLIFTGVALAVSVAGWSSFFPTRWGTWAWFAAYILFPVHAAIALWRYRGRGPAQASPVPAALNALLIAESIVFGFYGLLELLAPVQASAFWPWQVDAFHGRIYAGVFVGLAVSTWMISASGAALEYLSLGLTKVAIGVLVLLGTASVDAQVHRVDWADISTRVWIGVFAALALCGLASAAYGLRRLRRQPLPS